MTLAEKLNTQHRTVELGPEDLETMIREPRYYPWLRAAPPFVHERILRGAELVRVERLKPFGLLDPDMHPPIDSDVLCELGLVVRFGPFNEGWPKLPEVK